MDSFQPIVNNEKLRDMMAIWLIKRQRPLLTAEDPELVDIIKYLNPVATPVKADAIKNTVMRLYEKGRKSLKVRITINK